MEGALGADGGLVQADFSNDGQVCVESVAVGLVQGRALLTKAVFKDEASQERSAAHEGHDLMGSVV